MIIRVTAKLILIVWLFTTLTVALAAENWRDASGLLQRGNVEAAYQLLAPLEEKLAGDVVYDVLLASSADQSGRHTEAIFAYERLLSNSPDDTDARYQLARIHYRLGETTKAESAYQTLLEGSPTEQTRISAEQELYSIRQGMRFKSTRVNGYVGIRLGHDSNVNSATEYSLFFIPDSGTGTNVSILPAYYQEQSDSFGALLAGINMDYQINGDLSLYGKGFISKRNNHSKNDFNNGRFELDLGIKLNHQENQYQLGYFLSDYYLDGDEYWQIRGAIASWSHALSQNRAFQVSGFHGQIEYEGQSIRNVDRSTIALDYIALFSGKFAPHITAGIYLGEEDNHNSLAPYMGHDLKGIRMVGELTLTGLLTAYTALSYEQREYGGQDPLFITAREDNQASYALGLKYKPAPYWELVPEVLYLNNDSNLTAYEYDRLQFSLSLLRRF